MQRMVKLRFGVCWSVVYTVIMLIVVRWTSLAEMVWLYTRVVSRVPVTLKTQDTL